VDYLEDYKADIPSIFLDGELWIGRKKFTNMTPLFKDPVFANKKPDFEYWGNLRLIAFDCPNPNAVENFDLIKSDLDGIPFEERYSIVLRNISPLSFFVVVAPRMVCTSKSSMLLYCQYIVAGGGEGVMLRKPASVYENGRSHCVLKYKVKRDGEALVVANQGIYYKCQLPHGAFFNARKEGITYVNLNDVVSYKCQRWTNSGVPVQPIIYRVREDIKWQETIKKNVKSVFE